MSPTIKLTYFPFKARGEPTRLAFHIGGVPFEDERIEMSAFPALKPTLPFLHLPVLTVDGRVFGESNAMLRYAGKLGGLYPKCETDAMTVDMVVDAVEAVGIALHSDASADARAKWVAETVPRYIGALDKLYAEKSGPYLLGEQMSIADIKLMVFLEGTNDGKTHKHLPAGVLDKYAHVLAAVKAVEGHEKVKEWNAMHQ